MVVDENSYGTVTSVLHSMAIFSLVLEFEKKTLIRYKEQTRHS